MKQPVRNLVMIWGLVILTCGSAAALTVGDWALAPITFGDIRYTLMATDWASDTVVLLSDHHSGTGNQLRLEPVGTLPGNTIRTLTYTATIIDDPATPDDETALYDFGTVAFYPELGLFSGPANYQLDLDNDADFSSPVFSRLTLGLFNPLPVGGDWQELHVRLTVDFWSSGSAYVNYLIVDLGETEIPVATEGASFGAVKALFR